MIHYSITTISPDQPFVDVLAKGLLNQAGGDPLALAQMRILLPTRRAIRSLREAFLRLSKGKPMLLPHMQPIGEVDEEEMLLSGWLVADAELETQLPPAMPPSRRILQLAQLIWRYHQLEYGPHARMDQAVQLARELAKLLDDVAREELDIQNIRHIVPENLATHWQVTLDFLQIIMSQWPKILEEEGKIDPITRRGRMLDLLAEQWRKSPPPYPVVAAGTTGSVPATARLLRVIATLPQGQVVLPGWDCEMPKEVWDTLDETHPQYGMKQLLQTMGLKPHDVTLFGGASCHNSPRVEWLQAALRPAIVTDTWRQETFDWQQALAGCTRLSCTTVQEEATAIALLLRDALQTPGKTAALVTPNRDLARRVSAVLRRFHITIDDSAGIPLADMPAGVLLNLLSDVAINSVAPVSLLALLKHPLALAGLPEGVCRHMARQLERDVLRGVRLAQGFEPIIHEISQLGQNTEFAERIANICAPFLKAMQSREIHFGDLLRTHVAVAEALSTAADGTIMLWQGEEGEQLASFFHETLASAADMPAIDAASYVGMLGALMAGQMWRPHYGTHPRLHILSPMEARLQLYHRVILGGLNEGVWPADVEQDPWMSRPMRSSFGLNLPERQIGLSAHDFISLASAGEVVLTRAQKEGGSPSVPSRWLLRMEALLGVLGGEEAQEQWILEGSRWCAWAARLDAEANPQPCLPPAPTPPVEARPRELYVTKIETLLRNPYGVYASKILKLKKLDPLDEEPGAAEFGNLVHEAIEHYVKSGEKGIDKLIENGRRCFDALLDRPGVEAFWWPRFLRIAEWVAEEEISRAPHVQTIEAEQEAVMVWQAPAGQFALKARIDRAETLKDGTLRLIDYKTGAVPTSADIEKGIAAQLLLEAVINIAQGAAIADMEYWHLKGGRVVADILSVAELAAKKGASLDAWVEVAFAGVQALVAEYDNPATPYLHSPVAEHAPRFDDFEHLARVREWGVKS